MASWLARTVLGLALAATLAGCETTSPVTSVADRGYPVDFPSLTCIAAGHANGEVGLTASRVRPGDHAYIEFRTRTETLISSGHMFVVFGRLDEQGNPATHQYIGLFPKGGAVGLYGGAAVPVPAHLLPRDEDCISATTAAYRVSMTQAQYQALVAKVGSHLANPPLWHMLAFNCNHFAAQLGTIAGLHPPAGALLPSRSYIHAYIARNGDKP